MLYAACFIVGLIILVWSADRFVTGAAATARLLGMSALTAGILVVGIGTSAPEMLVSAIASIDGQAGLAVGNALGSNITNVALILGITALLIPLRVQSQIVNRELPLLLLVMFIALALLWDRELDRLDGVLLLGGMVLVLVRQVFEIRRSREDALAHEFEEATASEMTLPQALFWLLFAFLLLIASARLLVWGAVGIAHALGVSDLIIGLTVVAVGTSLPELAASVAAAKKNEHDIAIGNVIGSNVFNLVGVMGLPGVIAPGMVDAEVLTRDYPVMIVLTLLLFAICWSRDGSRSIQRWHGGVLLVIYVGYLAYLVATV